MGNKSHERLVHLHGGFLQNRADERAFAFVVPNPLTPLDVPTEFRPVKTDCSIRSNLLLYAARLAEVVRLEVSEFKFGIFRLPAVHP